MLISPDLELLMRVVDVSIILFSIGILVLLAVGGLLRSKFAPMSGRVVLVSGIALMVLIQAIDFMLMLLHPGSIEAGAAGLLNRAMPEWLQWTLSRLAFLLIVIGIVWSLVQRKRAEDKIHSNSDLIRAAQDSVVQSEARFRYLLDTTSNSIYCYSFEPPLPISLPVEQQIRRSQDAILTECNLAFARDIGVERVSEVIGSRMSLLDSSQDVEAHRKFFAEFIENNYRLTDYEFIYKAPDGEDRALSISLTGIVRDGHLQRMWGAESDILDMRRTRAALERRMAFQEMLASVSSRLVKATEVSAEAIVQECLRELCEYIGADRTTLFWLAPDLRSAEVVYSWNAAGNTIAAPLDGDDLPQCRRLISAGEILAIDNVSDLSGDWSVDKRTLQEQGVKSQFALPLSVAGQIVGILAYGHLKSVRPWIDQDVAELRVFGELFANFVYRTKSRQALDRTLNNLLDATDRLQAENVYLREEVKVSHGFDEIVAECDEMIHCLGLVEKVAETNTPVLILGETGTGKELIARAIHDRSPRRDRPLVKVNCAALPSNLIESELFGYEKGAFTGASGKRQGRFDLADCSTLFLDEIGDLPIELQSKLLRVLQEGEFERLGGSETISVDVRIIAATNRDLDTAVRTGGFRSDLLYRINTFPIALPPLRDRGDDIQLLAEHFVFVHAKHLGRNVEAISARMMQQLREYSWPGNVRELESVIQRALITWSGPVLELADPLTGRQAPAETDGPRVVSLSIAELRAVEREHILAVLEDVGWKISGESGAAAKLGIPPSTLRSKMKKLAIVRPS